MRLEYNTKDSEELHKEICLESNVSLCAHA